MDDSERETKELEASANRFKQGIATLSERVERRNNTIGMLMKYVQKLRDLCGNEEVQITMQTIEKIKEQINDVIFCKETSDSEKIQQIRTILLEDARNDKFKKSIEIMGEIANYSGAQNDNLEQSEKLIREKDVFMKYLNDVLKDDSFNDNDKLNVISMHINQLT
ncbi:MAG: hypothetical protein Terrestrivirus4_172 [Terrestrivirus sp.]|uniref:Uncharacterized protein n=1 Tax=Terrestrivirus sp. TaxID=2487775 RepID=A0A3G4ZP03_9VIRU|nr:MAG: hypothetical protein Terrestrivirus4_172 [Terrestrivirus sp.]